MENVHTAYVENVAEGADAEQVIRSLARKGFDTIFTTLRLYGWFRTRCQRIPECRYHSPTGYKANGENFGNLMGAMET